MAEIVVERAVLLQHEHDVIDRVLKIAGASEAGADRLVAGKHNLAHGAATAATIARELGPRARGGCQCNGGSALKLCNTGARARKPGWAAGHRATAGSGNR